MTRSLRQARVQRDQWRAQRLGEGDVCRIVGGQDLPQRLDPLHQLRVADEQDARQIY
jgi:hypothetical protein